jgi:predicted alpha-1,6-mannanase (GH76 family)
VHFLKKGLSFTSLLLMLVFNRNSSIAAAYQERADAALQSFLLKFWNGDYLRNHFPDDGSLTGYWTYAHGWDAVMDGVERTSKKEYLGLIESFYLGQNERGWIVGYYDDECWMTLALLRAYDLTGTGKYLNQAKTLYADIGAGWDSTCCGSSKGGLWWDKAHTQKASAANAGAALAGARLYLRTGDSAYLSFAQQLYSYWLAQMVNSATGQVCDHILPTGEKVWWKFTYNEGLMIGAAVELYEATANATYLANAHNFARFMVANETIPTAYGTALYDGTNDGCGGDCAEFKGPAYRYLMRLYAKDPTKSQYYNLLKSSADAIWNLARDSNDGVFAVNWAGPAETAVDQLQQNAAAIALNRFAQETEPFDDSAIPLNRFEAENATVHHLGFENIYGGYTGWGYLAAWNSDGQSVDFKVNLGAAARHTLTFRYSAGAGAASRLISINGANTFPNQSFPNTGAWTSYNTVTVAYNFPAGVSTISVVFNSALGSKSWLNLDNLVIPTLVPPPPGPLQVNDRSNSVTLSWTSLGTLQQSTNVAGPWTDAAGNPQNPVILSPNQQATNRFYRLRQ